MLTNTERQQIVEEVNAGTYGIDEALDDIAAAQKGEEVRKALYAEALVLNREGHAGSTDLIARQQIANLQTSVNGQISTLRTEVGDDIDDLETALNSGIATQNGRIAAQNGRIAAQNATIANVVANYNVEYGSTELWASTGETGALAAGTTVTLSEDVSHFDYIDIYSFCGNSNVLDTVPVDAKLQSNAGYALRWVNLSDPGSGSYKAYVRIIETRLHIIGTTLTIDHQVTYRNGEEVNISGAEITQSNRTTYMGELGIMKVVGRKITANTEIEDVRIGADGTEYASAGQAVRAQVTALESAIPAVDSTLSTQGAAADAKVAGDKVAELKSAFDNIAERHASRNLIDRWINGYFVNQGTGEIQAHNDFSVTDFISVSNAFVFSANSPKNLRICWYDANKTFINGEYLLGNTSDYSYDSNLGLYYKAYNVPNAQYVRASVYTRNSPIQIENGTTPTAYEPYVDPSYKIKESALPDLDGKINVDFNNLTFAKWENMFDHNSDENAVGKYLVKGALHENDAYTTTHFIEVEPNTEYSFACGAGTYVSNAKFVTEYDASRSFIKVTNGITKITTGATTKYIRFCVSSGDYSLPYGYVSMVEGDTPNRYAEHKQYIPASLIGNSEQTIHAFLPKDIYVAIGRTVELYNELVCLEANKYHFSWQCAIGVGYARKFSVTGTTVGNHTLTLTIVDDDLTPVFIGTSTIHVVSNTIANNHNIVPIGDSLTNGKRWQPEAINLSNSKIMYIGTRSGYAKDSEGNHYHYKHEGRSGVSASWYLGDNTYNFDSYYVGSPNVDGTSNPFWDGAKFSLQHYIDTQASTIGTPDAVQIFLGTNGMGLDPTANANNIKAIVDAIRSEFATIPIFVCYTIYRSNQNGYYSSGGQGYVSTNTYQYIEDLKVFNLMSKLYELLKSYTDLYMIPLATCMDRENDFGQIPTPVNPRLTDVTINIPAESVHPQSAGYFQMADVMFSTYCGALA